MSYRRRVLLVLLWAQVPLVVGIVLPFVGAVAAEAALSAISRRELLGYASVGAEVYLYALIGVLSYGAPVYGLLAHIGRANWFTATLVGIAPGVGALLIGIYPSGRLADANVTVGPMIMACGVFVALATHVLAREAATFDAAPRQVIHRSARPLSRVFVVGAILGEAWTFIFVRNAPPGSFGAVGVLAGTVIFVVPSLVAAFACALYSYFAKSKPRGVAPVVEMTVYVAIGVVLLIPGALVLGLIQRLSSANA